MKLITIGLLTLSIAACAPKKIGSEMSIVQLPQKIDQGDRFNDSVEEKDRPDAVPAHPDVGSADLPSESALTSPPSKGAVLSALDRRILKNAEYVVTKEKNIRGVGDACNFFLQRILTLSGFSDDGYLASDFDIYAKNHFRNKKTATFKVEPLRRDTKALQAFLESYPDETPFILQWEKKVGHGHLAIVTRKADKLIIYEASLGRFKAEKKLTTARTILSASERYKLTVYVDFMPSDK